MIVEGPAPPWDGPSRYGSWRRIEGLWDGTERWEYVAPAGVSVSVFGHVLKSLVLPTAVDWLNTPMLLLQSPEEVKQP